MAIQGEVVSLEDRVAAIRESRGENVAIDEIASVVDSLVTGGKEINISTIASELRSMLDYISAARDEVTAIRPKAMSEKDIPNASMELDAVVEATNNAATTIMDSADQLGEMAEEVGGEHGMALETMSMTLFEASSFQDLTGQRINKVSKTLVHLEERLSALAIAIGDVWEGDDEEPFDESGNVVNEDALLHGPQFEGEGNSQDDIDALLASFD